MEVTDKQIIDGMPIPVSVLSGMVLVKPMPEVMISKEITSLDEEANKDKDLGASEGDDVAEVKTEIKDVPANMRVGVVLTMDSTIEGFDIGDKVVYRSRAGEPFELFKDSMLLRSFDVVGKWLGK